MTTTPDDLLANNRRWAQKKLDIDADYFAHLSTLTNPKYMWIGCSDSRVPANEIIGLSPGQVFVHRNVANQVKHTDLNCLSAVQYAVEVLGVEHIIVTGHYDCGGVKAAMESQHFGIVDNWIRSIRDIYTKYHDDLAQCSEEEVLDRLCEFNVRQQVENLAHSRIVQNAWNRGSPLTVHGWIYALQDGVLHDLEITKTCAEDVEPIYRIYAPPVKHTKPATD